MSEREQAAVLLNRVPSYKLPYVLSFLSGVTVGEDIPNAETVAAMEETDEMVRTGKGQHFKGTTEELFASLDAEDTDNA